MGRVRQLPDQLIDQIAAGEVVERPASVVKELVENALDAGATRIRVEVRDGGSSWICVSDDGFGMSPEDARLALQRHATSKIHSVDDLTSILSYGFRGEALPSIASVSCFRLRTRERDADTAFEICLEGGKVVQDRACGGTDGTRIEVADLFATIPARRKFLKTAATEWSHILDWLTRVALVLPGVHFEICRDQKKPLVWPATHDPLARIAAVLSEEEAASLVPVQGEAGGLSLSGFASAPAFHRATTAGIYLYVNGRPVRDRLLRHAALQIYRDLLPRGRFPSVLLFLEVPAELVDVNVHPAKWEVRFAEPQVVHQLVRRSLRNSIQERSYLPGTDSETSNGTGEYIRGGGVGGRPHFEHDAPDRVRDPSTSDWIFARQRTADDRAFLEDAAPLGAAASRGEAQPGEGTAPGSLSPSRVRFSEYRLLGQVMATYLVLEGKDAILLVDQHAAHERVLYERLRARWVEGGVERQALLLPVPVELDPLRYEALMGSLEAAGAMGFEVEDFGEGAVAVRAVPAILAGRDPAGLVQTLADELAEARELGAAFEPGTRILEAVDKAFATLACHAARRKGDLLDLQEQRALLSSLDEIPWAPTCPHGRTVAVPLESIEIERRFSRR